MSRYLQRCDRGCLITLPGSVVPWTRQQNFHEKKQLCLFTPTETSLAKGPAQGALLMLCALGHTQAPASQPPTPTRHHTTPPPPPCQLPVCSINHRVTQIGRSAYSSRGEKSPTNVHFHGNQTQRKGRRNETCCLVFISVTAVFTPPPFLLVCALLDQSAFVLFFLVGFSECNLFSLEKMIYLECLSL